VDVETLRAVFRERYHSFKLLLGANNRALEIMSDIEHALQGQTVFDMAFVRGRCTEVTVSVHRMVRELDRLAPGKYPGLAKRCQEIRESIEKILDVRGPELEPRLVVDFEEADAEMAPLVGSKMAELCHIRNHLGVAVPDGFVVTTWAFGRFLAETGLQTEINRRFQTVDLTDVESLHALCAEVQQLVLRAPLPESLSDALKSACERLSGRLGNPPTLAFRSSAVGEDAVHSSFAGQYHSELNVDPDDADYAYKTVAASKYTPQAVRYRMVKGYRDEDIPMAVGCMVMVDAAAGGVAYSRNPLDASDDTVHINAVRGLPKAVVDGSTPCDLILLSRTDPPSVVRREIAVKTMRYALNPGEGIDRLPVDDSLASAPSIDDGQAAALAEIAMQLEAQSGLPQDMEWAIDAEGRVVVLQSRPLPMSDTVPEGPAASRNAGPDAEPEEEDDPDLIAVGTVTASGGQAWGEAYVAAKAADTLRFPEGAVLVIRQALPRWAALLDRAAAVVSEQGGVAGHLASVCREFGIPALFGVENATERLKTGFRITVDADRRSIYRGVRKRSAGARKPRPNLMAGSPVHRTLKRAGRLIIPLHLLDPDVASFRPENCATLHDITRFIHEKSVHEMFSFSKSQDFPERAARQLVHDGVPMQWWVLDLDDGIQGSADGKFVPIENIVSIPMLAFWEGFTAIPWDGPPAIDGGGFMSVMFRSTANPALATGVKSRYAQQNYFMVSRNYCSLNSRMGYHFAILEALVGERLRENYISFQFKGGAADDGRRRRRVDFIGDILEDNGFSVRIRNDHLSARMEGYPASRMAAYLKVLGYLNLHTRQLDMIMSNAARVDHYDRKLRADIDDILSGKTGGSLDASD
jgi:pyruvate,water dikinase